MEETATFVLVGAVSCKLCRASGYFQSMIVDTAVLDNKNKERKSDAHRIWQNIKEASINTLVYTCTLGIEEKVVKLHWDEATGLLNSQKA